MRGQAVSATPSTLPEIPRGPVRAPDTAGTAMVSEVRPLPVGLQVPILEDPAERAAGRAATLPATGLDRLIFFVAAAVSVTLGLALCFAGVRRT